jgi:hypothetical protein
MSKISFTEGLEVYYKGIFGVVDFVCDQYITVCVRKFPNERVRNVCLVVHPTEFYNIKLAKESTK